MKKAATAAKAAAPKPAAAASKAPASKAPASKAPAKTAEPVKKAAPSKKAAASGKKVAAKDVKKGKVVNPLFEKRPRSFGLGQNLRNNRDVTRYVRWPKYIRIQRQRRVLYSRLKVPPSIAQFHRTLDKSTAANLLKLLSKYKPETRRSKRLRLKHAATKKTKDSKGAAPKKVLSIKYGLNHITHLVEQKKAKLVVISHDVDPVELVLWLPALCRKMDVPYVIIKGKSRLGRLVYKKTAAAVAVVGVEKKDAQDLADLVSVAREQFNNNVDARRHWGGGHFGFKTRQIQRKRAKAVAAEAKARRGE